jgi:hypothetical protein
MRPRAEKGALEIKGDQVSQVICCDHGRSESGGEGVGMILLWQINETPTLSLNKGGARLA